MVTYRIYGPAANKRMRATRDIAAGEQILTEPPLIDLQLGPSRFYNNNNNNSNPLYAAANEMRETLEEAKADLSQPCQNDLDNLHNNWPAEGIVGIAKTNAWFVPESRGPHDYNVLKMYNEILRVNHSCTPNAEVTFNSSTRMGALHATVDILANADITISYLNEHDSLLERTPRRRELRETWRFNCQCTRCSLQPPALAQDDIDRRNARHLYNLLINQPLPLPTLVGRDNYATTRLGNAIQYRDLLMALDIKGSSLANAYNFLAESEEMLDEVTREMRELRNPHHCNNCDHTLPDTLISYHLEQASDAQAMECQIHERTHGKGHPLVEEELTYWQRMRLPIDIYR